GTPRHIGSRCGGMEESGDVLRVMHLLRKFTDMALDGLTWTAARSAVDAVRFQPAHTKLLMACGASQADAPQRWVGGVAALLARPRVARWLDLPHRGVRAVAGLAARWLGPTGPARRDARSPSERDVPPAPPRVR